MIQFEYINRSCQLPVSQGAANIDLTGANITTTPSTSQTELWYQDDNGPFLKRFLNDGAGGITAVNLDIAGNAYTPVGTQSPLQSSTNFKQICTKCMLDDTANDGSNLVPYVDAFLIEVNDTGAVTSTDLGDYTDECLNTAYTIVGTPTDPNTTGTPAIFKSQRREFTDAFTWSPPATAHSFTIVVEALGAGVTFQDSDGIVTNLRQGRSETWAHDETFSDNAPIITGSAGSIITVNYTEIG